ncbi:hypothetical protein BC829DRAFT_391956 [Chytridium lagenaria]|nr:hypothetical protein BC829DRAFT_391956 [Chytridium lagenaria]
MKINSYTVRALQAALGRGNGVKATLTAPIKNINIAYGPNSCGSVNALKVFSVNELPRIHTNNPGIIFTTSSTDKKSFIKFLMQDGKEQVLDLANARTPAEIYVRFSVEAGLTESEEVSAA